jgi:methylthioribose-1-phosphate isomerase
MTPPLQALVFREGQLSIINQLLLPHVTVYETIHGTEEGFAAIKEMKVRGAPAIALVAALSLATELHGLSFSASEEAVAYIHDKLQYLQGSRPTAVNLSNAIRDLSALVTSIASQSPQDIIDAYISATVKMMDKDVRDNVNLGTLGAAWILTTTTDTQLTVLTHCNTGSLATAGYGTAIGVIHSLMSQHNLHHVYCTETRPYMQGARLTAYELCYASIPTTLVCDSMVAALFASRKVHAVVVGADRVARNGDTANKIGTMQIALLARHFKVPFVVCAPWTTIDLDTACGTDIVIEERSSSEVKNVQGMHASGEMVTVTVADSSVNVWNPAFDVTPAEWIDAIVTDKRVYVKQDGVFTLN